ncbi:hypothetical protein ACIQCR_32985 [Streptomyces sp. NPDC093249]|uniref:hypothetical protein n=1 Tax=Streptomyces sp. NPDC093249 TaxID=3366035 RepID=UPI00382193CF
MPTVKTPGLGGRALSALDWAAFMGPTAMPVGVRRTGWRRVNSPMAVSSFRTSEAVSPGQKSGEPVSDPHSAGG